MSQSDVIYLFTDGSSSGNPGPGGWGFILTDESWVKEDGGFEDQTTNNRMELMALLKALECYTKQLNNGTEIRIYSDSVYLILSITRWLPSWKKNGMKKKDGEAVKNPDLLLQIDDLLKRIKIPIHWFYLPAHQGIPANERVDRIAVQMGKHQNVTPPLFEGTTHDYFIPFFSGLDLAKPAQELPENYVSFQKPQPLGYLVYLEEKISIPKDWATAEALVKNKKGALYKKVFSKEEVQTLLAQWGVPPEKAAQFLKENF